MIVSQQLLHFLQINSIVFLGFVTHTWIMIVFNEEVNLKPILSLKLAVLIKLLLLLIRLLHELFCDCSANLELVVAIVIFLSLRPVQS